MSRNNGSPAGACHRAAIRPTRWRATTAESVAYSYSSDTASRSHGAMRPSCAFIFRPLEGVGNAGCPLHPRPRVHFVLVERTRVTTSTPERPAFPHAMVLTAYVVLSPVTGLFCHRRQRISGLSAPGWADLPSTRLDASVGASGPHDFAVRSNRLSSARLVTAHRFKEPALRSPRAQNAAASTASRPYVRDDGQRPSVWDGIRKVLEVIWGVRKQKYFCKQDWTGSISLIRFNKFAVARKSKQRGGAPSPGSGPLMGRAHR